jgi:hypothetical protein
MLNQSFFFYEEEGILSPRPRRGGRYFITATDNGGEITSLTKMNKVLDWAVKNNPDSIKVSMDQVSAPMPSFMKRKRRKIRSDARIKF